MPSIRVRALPQKEDAEVSTVLNELCEIVAECLGAPVAQVRAIWQTIDAGSYAEDGVFPKVQPYDTHPPIVELVAFIGRTPEVITNAVEQVANTLVKGLGLSEGNAWVSYVEAGRGELFVNGSIKE